MWSESSSKSDDIEVTPIQVVGAADSTTCCECWPGEGICDIPAARR